MNPTNTKPHGAHRGASFQTRAYQNALGQLYGKPRKAAYLPRDWRNRLPDPASYYAQHVQKLTKPNATGWAQGRCPFHEDHNASLSVHVTGERGHWRCFASCGGGDLVGFHQRITGLDFVAAVRDLIGLEVR